jgi:hypothetical protein
MNAVWFPSRDVKFSMLPGIVLSRRPSIGTDGTTLYILTRGVWVILLSLSQRHGTTELQVKSLDGRLSGMSNAQMVVCGGCAIFSDGVNVAVCSVPTLTVLAPPKAAEVSLPMATDGRFVYSLSVKNCQVSVFAVESNALVKHENRRITLHSGPHMERHFSELIPKGELAVVCNGSVLTIVVLLEKSTEFRYLWRSFSAFDESHICDQVTIQAWPIYTLVCDLWQSAVWEVTCLNRAIKLVRLPNYGARAWFLSGISSISVTPAALLAHKLNGITTGKLLFKALLEFFVYYAIHFFRSLFPSMHYQSNL